MIISQRTLASTDDISTKLAHIPLSLEDQPIPLVRIYTCGGLRIEVLQQPANSPEQAQYRPPSPQILAGRGTNPAQMLLKHLLSAPHHYRSLDWLQEYWYASDKERIGLRFDNRAWYLRKLLCPPYLQEKQHESSRRALVSHVNSHGESGPGYRLEAYPLIWIDVDALDWNVQQACRMERYGDNDNALPFWEQAYSLASQGHYLPEEAYSDWAEPRRSAVMGALRQSVYALTRLYAYHGERGKSEVLRLLRDYLLQFPTDEDALRLLIDLLGHQERFQEIKQMVERTQRYLEVEGETLDARTLDLWEYLRVKPLSRQRMGTNLERQSGQRSTSSETPYPAFLHLVTEGVAEGITKALVKLEQQTTRERSILP